MPPKLNKYKSGYAELKERRIVLELVTIRSRKYTNKDTLDADIQKLRKLTGEWYNFNLHQPIDSGSIKILGMYNHCLRDHGYDSEFELDDNGVTYSDFSSAESIASDKSEINDVETDFNPSNDFVEQASDSKDNLMDIEHSLKNVTPTDININTNVKSDGIQNNGIGDDQINSVIVNNCDAINMSKGETPECNVDANIMNIDPPDSNLKGVENDGYRTQGRKRGRVPSNEAIPSKKLTRSNSLPLRNKFNVLANLPDTGNNQNPTNALSQTKIPKVLLKLKQINEIEGIKRNAKEAGEFIKLFCETPRDVRKLTEYLDKNNKEYFVIPGKVVKPIKIVIKGLPIDTDLDEIKTELVNKKFRVEKVNQLKRYKTSEPLNIYQIHLFPSDNIKEIYHLATLSYHFITVEPYENRQHHQCFNCQMWNHGSKGCKLNPKCVICAGKHPSKECPHKGKKEAEIKCTNCNGPHTARYRGCPKYPKNIMKNRIQPGKSFAAAANKNVNKPAPPPETIYTESVNFPPLSTKTTIQANSNPAIDNNLGPKQENLSAIMELATEVSKIFQSIKDVPETLKVMKEADILAKFMVLAEALR
ncbi:hypothetical protein AVEN_202034-1 [Araneus ventricosus]|uniref:Pre-C2HC domain-containing protein n=1 Tax=Araneus ventricosus TaxID=182803 RepID=A0A4Y2F6A5_ARAVE|nr:hypothetical protein AVEN_58812-1 [Araneus ventricosus]GBM36701.1 hypothetical protein AVEN_77676-1 [Araneus ventricosus]GBM36724.1 hypothetical protein AVEN_131203-1 [Araneus ventricosus]GBM36766.1 hypothetical protein AVEN_202034-1 [Araneus ventricosus]